MGKPVKIYDLAINMINLYSDKKIDIIFTSLGKGEKLYEELLCKDENILHTKNKNIMKLKCSDKIDYEDFINKFDELINNKLSDEKNIILFKNIVVDYK